MSPPGVLASSDPLAHSHVVPKAKLAVANLEPTKQLQGGELAEPPQLVRALVIVD
jgi:hypothetical protein